MDSMSAQSIECIKENMRDKAGKVVGPHHGGHALCDVSVAHYACLHPLMTAPQFFSGDPLQHVIWA